MRERLVAAAACAIVALAAPASFAEAEQRPRLTAQAQARDRQFEAAFAAAQQGDLSLVQQALRTERRPELRTLLHARLAAARYAPGVHRDPALARIAATSRDPGARETALTIITGAAFAEGNYSAAAEAGAASIKSMRRRRAAPGELAGPEQTHALAALLAAHPGQRVEGAVAEESVPLRYDAVGLPRINLVINGSSQEAVFDTGANLSVLTVSAARRLGVRIEEGDVTVGNSVASTVPVRIGIANQITIAGTMLRNVAFLIIEDAQLTFPQAGGYSIAAIIGLPVIRALERVRVEPARLTVERALPYDLTRQNMFAATSNLFVSARIGGLAVPLHLDSGANQTGLSARFAERHPALVSSLAVREQRLGGAGGASIVQAAVWRDPLLEVAGRSIRLPGVNIALPGPGGGEGIFGALGSDTLRRFASYAIDLKAMRLELGAPGSAP